MESNEVSIHEVRLYLVFSSKSKEWITAKDAAALANIAERTARSHCQKLVNLGILDLAEVFPGHRYRLSQKASKRNTGYAQRLKQACEVFGLA